MVLAVDIGNTNIVMGCFDGTELKFRERISTNQLATDLEYAATIKWLLICTASGRLSSRALSFRRWSLP